jgi:pimeloyl-ACP methyl ester carboxylesterase
MSTYVLVHGAWHGAWCWFKTEPLLQKLGHTVITPDLPAHGIDKSPTATVTLKAYAERIVAVLDACPEPVILVGHSMGGIVITEAAQAIPDKVSKLVYVTAFLLQDGETLLDVANQDPLALVMPNLVMSADGSSAMLKDEVLNDAFYGDCSPSDIALARSLLVPQAGAPFATPVHTTADAWGSLERFYIECLQDRAISIDSQRSMINKNGVVRVHSMNTSHSPFLSAPQELVDHLVNL